MAITRSPRRYLLQVPNRTLENRAPSLPSGFTLCVFAFLAVVIHARLQRGTGLRPGRAFFRPPAALALMITLLPSKPTLSDMPPTASQRMLLGTRTMIPPSPKIPRRGRAQRPANVPGPRVSRSLLPFLPPPLSLLEGPHCASPWHFPCFSLRRGARHEVPSNTLALLILGPPPPSLSLVSLSPISSFESQSRSPRFLLALPPTLAAVGLTRSRSFPGLMESRIGRVARPGKRRAARRATYLNPNRASLCPYTCEGSRPLQRI